MPTFAKADHLFKLLRLNEPNRPDPKPRRIGTLSYERIIQYRFTSRHGSQSVFMIPQGMRVQQIGSIPPGEYSFVETVWYSRERLWRVQAVPCDVHALREAQAIAYSTTRQLYCWELHHSNSYGTGLRVANRQCSVKRKVEEASDKEDEESNRQ